MPHGDPEAAPRVEIVYRRPGRGVRRHAQELLHAGPACAITLMPVPVGSDPVRLGPVRVPPGGAVLWFAFPGEPWEVAAAFDSAGERLGWYTNLVRPFAPEGRVWRIADRCLDVWQGPDGEPELLDEEELEEAVAAGALDEAEAQTARSDAVAVIARARAGEWPPRCARRWTADAIPSLRFRRDAPGAYYANLVIGRLIAFGIYALGALSLTSLGFAALTDAFAGRGPAQTAWLATLGVELAVLLGLALAGRLPATRRPRPREALTERTLFLGALVAGIAVLISPSGGSERAALAGVYGVLLLFLATFAWCRARYDGRFPALALAGAGVCAVALAVLLA